MTNQPDRRKGEERREDFSEAQLQDFLHDNRRTTPDRRQAHKSQLQPTFNSRTSPDRRKVDWRAKNES